MATRSHRQRGARPFLALKPGNSCPPGDLMRESGCLDAIQNRADSASAAIRRNGACASTGGHRSPESPRLHPDALRTSDTFASSLMSKTGSDGRAVQQIQQIGTVVVIGRTGGRGRNFADNAAIAVIAQESSRRTTARPRVHAPRLSGRAGPPCHCTDLQTGTHFGQRRRLFKNCHSGPALLQGQSCSQPAIPPPMTQNFRPSSFMAMA